MNSNQCSNCNKVFKYYYLLQKHRTSIKSKCKINNNDVEKKKDDIAHSTAPTALKVPKMKDEIIENNIINDIQEPEFRCNICDINYTYKKSLIRHLNYNNCMSKDEKKLKKINDRKNKIEMETQIRLQYLETKIKEFEAERNMNNTLTNTNSNNNTLTNTNSNNTINNTINNNNNTNIIKINPFGCEDLSSITQEKLIYIFKDLPTVIERAISEIYSNPENKNFGKDNVSREDVKYLNKDLEFSYDDSLSFIKLVKKNLFKNLVYIINKHKRDLTSKQMTKYMVKIIRLEQALNNTSSDESFNQHAQSIISNFLRKEYRDKKTLDKLNDLLEYLAQNKDYMDELITFYHNQDKLNNETMLEYSTCPDNTNELSLDTEEQIEDVLAISGNESNLYLYKEKADIHFYNKSEAKKDKMMKNLNY